MTDPDDHDIRRALRTLELPPAPQDLTEFLIDLPVAEASRVTGRNRRTPWILLAAGLGVAVASISIGSLIERTSKTSASQTPFASDAPSVSVLQSPSQGRRFEAPGFSMVMPDGWTDQSSVVEFPDIPEQRIVGILARGLHLCAIRYDAPGPPTPQPSSCQAGATEPGTATLTILESPRQFPWVEFPGEARRIAGYDATEQVGTDQTEWSIRSPDGGLYTVTLSSPASRHQADVEIITSSLETLRLSSWEPAPLVDNGRIHEDPKRGFTFDYPATWLRFYPMDISTMDAAVVTVASGELAPPCAGSDCQRFSTPASTVAIEFRIGGGPTSPDWSTATTKVGGQPATVEDWGPTNVTGADEGHTWNVRLAERDVLEIFASLRGPGLPALRALMDEVLRSVAIKAG